ncbi:hypothetical protein PCE1_003162 [Barthelona sp. PCE]
MSHREHLRKDAFRLAPIECIDCNGHLKNDENDQFCNHTNAKCLKHRLDHLKEELNNKEGKPRASVQEGIEFIEFLIAESRSNEDIENEARESEERSKKASTVSLVVNIILLITKAIIFYFSGSIVILASLLDSCVDLLSGLVLFIASIFVSSKKPTHQLKFPSGKSRIEPLSVVIFSTLMGALSLEVILSAVNQLLEKATAEFTLTSFLIIIGVALAKLILFIYCNSLAEKGSTAAEALAQDHRNDVITNVFGGVCAYLGSIWQWWLDPVGAILFSIFIFYTWFETASEHASGLIGVRVDAKQHAKIAYIVTTFDERILGLERLVVFSHGSTNTIDVGIMLHKDMPLQEAHDIGLLLEKRLLKEENSGAVNVHLCTPESVEFQCSMQSHLAESDEEAHVQCSLTAASSEGLLDGTEEVRVVIQE